MAKPGSDKPESRDEPIGDPSLVQESLRRLFEAEAEFPIKVEGTSTLPYSSQIHSLDFEHDRFVLKLVRPLPHELMAGAVFRLIFAVDEVRLEGLITFLGREAYLQYGFQLPASLFHADRRRHKRHPFRPRENAYVIAQASGLPGLGLAGPLVNIGLGGFAMRVDRVIKLDDGMRIPPNTALFERGKGFNRVRIQDLPRLKYLEVRGLTSYVREQGSEVILGMAFNGLDGEEEAALAKALELRERIYHTGLQLARPEGGAGATASGAFASSATATGTGQLRMVRAEDTDFLDLAPVAEAPAEVTTLLRLQRRSTWVLLVMAPSFLRAALANLLREHGYHRLELLDRLDQVQPFCQADPRAGLPHLLLADLDLARAADAEPLAAVRIIEHQLAELGDLPMVFLCKDLDPTLVLVQGPHTRFMSCDFGEGAAWIGGLDRIIVE